MTKLQCLAFFLLVCGLTRADQVLASASVSASFSSPAPGDRLEDYVPFSDYYSVVVSNGSGNGNLFIDLDLTGTTQEGLFSTAAFAGFSQVTSPFPYVIAANAPPYDGVPSYSCTPTACEIPFTFNVPQIVLIAGEAEAYFNGYIPTGSPSPVTVSAAVDLQGWYTPGVAGTIINVTQLPEPQTSISVLGGLCILIGMVIKRLQSDERDVLGPSRNLCVGHDSGLSRHTRNRAILTKFRPQNIIGSGAHT